MSSWNGIGLTWRARVALVLAVVAAAIAPAGAQASPALNEYTIPTATMISGIAKGPDGALWFTESTSGNKIGRITTSGSVTEYLIPTINAGSTEVTSGPDGALWFTENLGTGNKVGRITTSGSFTEYTIPTLDSGPTWIVTGSDGALWFDENIAGKIGRVTTSGSFTEYTVPTASSSAFGIAAGPDGALWFTEQNANKIGRITTSGSITEYAVPTGASGPWGIASGPDGALWFTEYGASKIGRITTSGSFTEYSTPNASSGPTWIASGPDGALWFAQYDGGRIGRITTSGSFTQYAPPNAESHPFAITSGPDGALWFTEYWASTIGQLVIPSSSNTALPTISGTPELTRTLTANPGSWSGAPSSFSYQWVRCNPLGNNCANIAGATSQTYTVGATDLSSTLRVAVTATGVGSAQSDYVTVNAAPSQTIQQDAACVQGQVNNPNPSNGDQVCQAAGSAVVQANQAKNTALGVAAQAQDIVNSVVNSPPAGQYSNTCNSTGATIADGYAGSNTYVTLRAQPNPGNSAQEWICYRISNPNAGSVGGRVTVSGAGASFGVPSVDSSVDACHTAPNNTVPPPHPLVSGSLLSQSLVVDSYASSNTAWVCLTAGSTSDRVVVPVPGLSGSPSVSNQLDAPPPPLPSPPVDPYPSGSCQNGGGSQLMNANVGGVQTWAYSWQPNGSTADVCARIAGAVSAGGVLSVSTAGSPGVTPVLQTGTNPAPCMLSIFTIATPPQAASSLSTSPAGANPATVCVGAGSSMNTYTVGTSGGATPPTVTWTPDPGTP